MVQLQIIVQLHFFLRQETVFLFLRNQSPNAFARLIWICSGRRRLEIRNEFVIISMRTDPVPDNGVAGSNADSSPTQGNPY
jgi:hypothetical protein